MNKFRSRTHMLLLYTDNEQHIKAYDYIKKNFDYAAILHNKDYYTDGDKKGELKKEHLHVILRFTNHKWNTALAEELGIELKFIEEVKKFDNALMYLLHYNDTDKAQYTIDEVQGNLKTKLNEIINKIEKSEGEKVVELIQFIRERADYVTVTEFASYCAENGYWSEFRRSGSIFCKILEEHNYYIEQKRQKNKKD